MVGSTLEPYHVHRRGEIWRRTERFTHSGLRCDVSEAEGSLAAQAADAISFLSTHEAELERLRAFPGAEDLRLDFGYFRREVFVQNDYLPPELLLRAGRLGIGIELSLYPTPSPEPTAA